ncbi:SoxR reducing system RseC family protein [Allochromatium palmeri]|uniref:Fis family transcriptional regulator n=1 Tax=Allochromatium palmeri TaxID=231048 RepID=A0A6N8EHE1_9GAMM|nr:SoxR reducing system RseC family protein [Allochromatium palmeri]MTW21734.1 Fis family transcriptional regulator [Allochromatium palmeri]
MIEERGQVIAIVGDQVRITAERRSACGQCSVNNACGTSLLERVFGRHPVELLARNPIGAQVGDEVVVGLSEEGFLRTAAAAYLMPILGLIIGASLGERFGGAHPQAASVLGALAGLALAFWWLRGYSVTLAQRPERQPVILRRLNTRVSVTLSDMP